MWHLVDFLACWMLLSCDARQTVIAELREAQQPRTWRFEPRHVTLIGA